MLKNSILLLSVSTLLSPIVALLVEILTHWSFNCPCRSTSLAIKLVLFTLQVTSDAWISTRDPATEWPSCFVRRCAVLLHSIVCNYRSIVERGFLSLFVTDDTALSQNLIATEQTTFGRFCFIFFFRMSYLSQVPFLAVFALARPLPLRLLTQNS